MLSETLHFGKTAELANLSASAVSRLVQRLEQQVGQVLVERDNRHVRLTPAGRHFLEYARRAAHDWQKLRSDFSGENTELNGEISVFASVTASYSVLAQILPEMRGAYPGLEIKLRTGDQADGVERVLEGSEDSAIVAIPDNCPQRLAFLPLQVTPLLLIGPNTPSALTRDLDAILAVNGEPEWDSIPFVLAERGLARERLLDRMQALDIMPSIYAQVAGHEAVVSMVSLGFGIALVPELVMEHSPKRQTIRELPWIRDLPPFQLGLCVLRDRLADPLLKAFWDCAYKSNPNRMQER